ncbi:MAG: bifunctional glutamate N-acetyltransferase/amino-acid acetyltransferase ArgJ [Arenicella sp.]|jgi:glutamate N-acetyltransferase/amino-acid N-acetyltransferase|nr:bifunctional glutamate N-acetyltransferase/amino-acid acetyltransferase ArgJ [Arenicella sp.]
MPVNLTEPNDIAPVAGVQLQTIASGMRYRDRDDLLLMHFCEGSVSSALFTQNKFCAAPVLVAKEHLKQASARALLINAGNANAGTGQQGLDNCNSSCQSLSQVLDCDPQAVLPFSTGVIGEQMEMQALSSGITSFGDAAYNSSWVDAAKAIMTTDTVAKASSRTLIIDGQFVTVSGIAKGSGMICPNMATMLAFVATDAVVSQTVLDDCLKRATDASFNRITVDGDTSTNDAVVLSATGKAGHALLYDSSSDDAKAFYVAVHDVLLDLAQAIIRDGEGATKFVTVEVKGGKLQSDCEEIAYSIAHSPLVKTAMNASDPNWGRLLMAIGKAPTKYFDIDVLNLAINGLALIERGQPHPDYSEEQGQREFQKEEITISVDLNLGGESYTVWTSDLSHEYVRINADYRS